MNYALYPTPNWSTPERWKEAQKSTPWRIDAIIRDKYRCVDCHNGSKKLYVHHIDVTGSTSEENNSPTNLVTLCQKCHAKRHGLNGSLKSEKVGELLKKFSDKDKNLMRGACTEIGKKVGLSRERIRQLANNNGFTTPNNKKNVFMYSKCIYCGKKFKRNIARKTCSSSCSRNYLFYNYWTITECKQCHLYFIVRRSALENHGRYYCGKTCQGKWLSENYGFSITNNHLKSVKYDINNLQKDLPDLFTKQDFAKKYNYASETSAYSAIHDLMFKGYLESYNKNVRNLFRVKQKSVVDKSR